MIKNNSNIAVLRSSAAPDGKTKARLEDFLRQRYGQEIELEWEKDPDLEGGFIIQVGTDVYDWSIEGRLRQFKERLDQFRP